jgi:uncharacterized integral membrane protein
MNSSIERVYKYQLKRKGVAWVTIFVGALAIAIAYFASTNTRGMRITNTGSTLSTNEATVFLWILFAAMVAIVLLCAALLVSSYRVQQRIAFTDTEVIVPRSFWSSREKHIAYDDIQDISIRNEQHQRWLVIKHSVGKSNISGAMLANGEVFDAVVNLLAHKVRTARDS